ncbi:MAG: glutamine amidotransferase, partial [Firmicutes bacterium]|nr:glutamine amidotransferase [Bacillota bacterium]
PVEVPTEDDRINQDQAAVVRQTASHAILDDLPWDEHPPLIGGFNCLQARDESHVLLDVLLYRIRRAGGGFHFADRENHPLLVVGEYGKGRTAALACDLAPHWVGPLIDWGTQNDPTPSGQGRVTGQAPGVEAVEVGCHYATFVSQLIRWVGNLD